MTNIRLQPVDDLQPLGASTRNRWSVSATQANLVRPPVIPQPVTIDLYQGGLDRFWRDTRIVDESQKSERMDAGMAVWHVAVPANGTAIVTATFDTRF